MRTHRNTVVFGRPFRLKSIGRVLPPGSYQVVTDEELIEGLSFPVWHRVSTAIIIPAEQASSIEMVAVDPRDLQAAQDGDRAVNSSVAQECQANRGDLGYAESGEGKRS